MTLITAKIRESIIIEACSTSYKEKCISIINNESIYGKYIGRIEFRGLNDTYEQVIKSIDSSTVDNTEYKYPPEWLNLDATSLKNSIVIMTEIEEARPTT